MMHNVNSFSQQNHAIKAIESAPFCVAYLTASGIVTYVNDFIKKTLPELENIVGKNIFETRYVKEREWIQEAIKKLTPENNFFINNSRSIYANGKYIDLKWHTYALFDDDENIIQLVSYSFSDCECAFEENMADRSLLSKNKEQFAPRSTLSSMVSILLNSEALSIVDMLHLINNQMFADASMIFMYDPETALFKNIEFVVEPNVEICTLAESQMWHVADDILEQYKAGIYRIVEGDDRTLPEEFAGLMRCDVFRTMIILPIILDDCLYGLYVVVRSNCPYSWTSEDVDQFNAYKELLRSNIKRDYLSNNLTMSDRKLSIMVEKYRRLLQNAPIGIIICDKDGRVTTANNKVLEVLGMDSMETVLSLNIFSNAFTEDIVETENDNIIREVACDFNKLKMAGIKTIYSKIRYINVGFSLIRDNRGNTDSYIISLMDNTENHDRENYFKESRGLLSDILNSLPVPMMVKDVDDDFRYIYWNEESSKQSGIDTLYATGRTDFDIYGPERGQMYRDVDVQLISSGVTSARKEEVYVTPDGVPHHSIVIKQLIDRPNLNRWLVVIRWDITDIKKAQQKLEKSYKALTISSTRLNAALMRAEEANSMRSMVLNSINSGLIYINSNYEVQWESTNGMSLLPFMSKYTRGELCHKSVFGKEFPCENCPAVETMKTGVPSKHLVHENGVYIEIASNPVLSKANEVKGVVLKFEDVTQSKHAEIELRKAKEAAEEADILKSTFLANMSHEIRTPLNAIVGFSELLASSDIQDEKDEYLKIIRNNNDLLLQLIGDILDLSKIESNSLEFVEADTDVNELMGSIEQTARYRINKKGVNLFFEDRAKECVLYVDRNRLTQVITNFINNSIKFTDSGSIRFGYRFTDTGDIYFYVTDTGIGIMSDKVKTVFNRFVKLNTYVKGTGLGLSICKSIINHWNGQIGVESQYGDGSTFWFLLPSTMLRSKVVCEVDTESVVAEDSADESDVKQYKVLIAEDQQSNFQLLDIMLRKKYKTLHARDGFEAVEMYEEHRPDVILMDLNMPMVDGYQATNILRQQKYDVPIIAITANAFASDQKRCLENGFNDFLAKPVTIDQVNKMLEKWLH